MSLRVLHLLTALGHGGAESWLLNLIVPLRKLGVEIGFGLKAPQLGTLRHVAGERGAPTYDLPLPLTQVEYVREVRRIARREHYDIIHTHELVYGGVGVLSARYARTPAVMTLHHYTFEAQTALTRRLAVGLAREAYGRLTLKYALSRANAITAFSTAVMSRVYPGYQADPRCRLLRLSVGSLERAAPEARARLRTSLGLEPTCPLVIHVGRFVPQKNHAGMLRIFRRVLRARPDARLIFMGHGPTLDEVLSSARDLTDRGQARYLGSRDDVQELFAAADVLLFPSLNEGFGLVALEANACGLPVVATRVPGLTEALVDGETAILKDVSDEDGLAAAVLDVINDPRRARHLAERGMSTARSLYSHEASAALLRDVYANVAR